jgi:hypothetical protein
MQTLKQSTMLTHFQKLENLIGNMIEAKLNEFAKKHEDPIFKVRGILKGKKGGSALFIQDKRADIEKEYKL